MEIVFEHRACDGGGESDLYCLEGKVFLQAQGLPVLLNVLFKLSDGSDQIENHLVKLNGLHLQFKR